MKIGNHDIAFEEPDLFLVRVDGAVLVREVEAFCAEVRSLSRGRSRVLFLVDVSGIGEFGGPARRRLAEQMRPVPSRGVVFVGAGFSTRVVLQMVIHAVRLLTGRDNPSGYFDTDAEARAWIEATRAELDRRAPVRGPGSRGPGRGPS
jgi:hypothetical protein